MEQHNGIEMQLWEYIDGTCSDAARLRIDALIANDAVWQQKYKELTAFHNSLSAHAEMDQPSMRFSKNVMDAIAAERVAKPAKKYIDLRIIKGIAAFFIICICGLLGYVIISAGGQTTSTGNISLMNRFHFSSLFNNSFFELLLAANGILLLVFVDMLRKKKTA